MAGLLVVLLGPLIVLIANIILIVRLIPGWRLARLAEAEQDRRTLTDVSDQEVYIPDSIRDTLAGLEAMGYRRLGACDLFAPESPGLRRYWVLADDSGTMGAIVNPTEAGLYLSLRTCFEDGAWLETASPTRVAYPRPLRLPDFWLERAPRRDLPSLIETHQRRMAEFGAAHGAARPLASMADYIQQGAVYAERHRPRLLRVATRTVERFLASSLLVALILLALPCLAALFLYRVLPLGREFWWGYIGLLAIAVVMMAAQRIVLRLPVRRV